MTKTDTEGTNELNDSKGGRMRLTRRDAVLSLFAGSGASVVGLAWSSFGDDGTTDGATMTDARVDTLVAVADVIYPSEVSGIEEFVTGYVDTFSDSRRETVASAVVELDDYARRTRGERFLALPIANRDSVLRAIGVDRTGSSPDGSVPERIRYYVVNQLLYGLYTSPTGSGLLGIQNPIGHPGGYESYQNSPTTGSAGLIGEFDSDE